MYLYKHLVQYVHIYDEMCMYAAAVRSGVELSTHLRRVLFGKKQLENDLPVSCDRCENPSCEFINFFFKEFTKIYSYIYSYKIYK